MSSVVAGQTYADQSSKIVSDVDAMDSNEQEDIFAGCQEGVTVMLKSIACLYTQEDVKVILDNLGLMGKYNVIYIPRYAPRSRRRPSNLGYAFVNFLQPEFVDECRNVCDGKIFGWASTKECQVMLAHSQDCKKKATGKGWRAAPLILDNSSNASPQQEEVAAVNPVADSVAKALGFPESWSRWDDNDMQKAIDLYRASAPVYASSTLQRPALQQRVSPVSPPRGAQIVSGIAYIVPAPTTEAWKMPVRIVESPMTLSVDDSYASQPRNVPARRRDKSGSHSDGGSTRSGNSTTDAQGSSSSSDEATAAHPQTVSTKQFPSRSNETATIHPRSVGLQVTSY